MYTIKVKNEKFCGERHNIGFTNGIGFAEDLTKEQKSFFQEVGYEVIGEQKALNKMKKEELLEKASELGIEIEDTNKIKVDEIIELIKEKTANDE